MIIGTASEGLIQSLTQWSDTDYEWVSNLSNQQQQDFSHGTESSVNVITEFLIWFLFKKYTMNVFHSDRCVITLDLLTNVFLETQYKVDAKNPSRQWLN